MTDDAPEPAETEAPPAEPNAAEAEPDKPAAKDDESTKDEEGKDKDEENLNSAQDRATDPDEARSWRSFGAEMNAALRNLVGVDKIQLMFGEFRIDQVGDRYHAPPAGDSAVALRSGEVPRTFLDQIEVSFVEPTRYPEIKHKLEAHQLVLIRTRVGSGRTTTALRLLDQLCRDGVRKLDPDAKLKSLGDKDLTRNNGYLLEWLDPEQARNLRVFHTDRLMQLMRDIGCHLVVIVDETTVLPMNDIGHLVIPDLGTVAPEQVVRRHATRLLRGTTGEQSKIAALEAPEVKEILADLTDDIPNRELATLAGELVGVVSDQAELASVRERYSRTSNETFTTWFDDLESSEQRAFVISLAVFNNEPAQLVSDAATWLAQEIQKVEVPRRADRGRSVFSTPLRKKILDAHAEVFVDTEDTDFGPVSVRRARFRDQRFPRRILEYVRGEYDLAFDVVRQWLIGLGDTPRRVRVRAGMAAGLLSLSDFTGIYESVILPWASSGELSEREAAIAALQIPSREPAYAGAVYTMLDRWLKHKIVWNDSMSDRQRVLMHEARARKITAVRALGSTEATSTTAALKMLRRTARHADWGVAYAVGETMSELYCRIDDPGQVLDELVRWTGDDQHPLRRETGLLSVLAISCFVVVNVVASAEKWPVLVGVAEHMPEHRDRIVLLFSRMLVAAEFQRRGYIEIQRWTKIAQKDPTLRRPLGSLLLDIGRESGELDSIRYYLDYWAAARNGPADAVRDMLEHFDREESLT